MEDDDLFEFIKAVFIELQENVYKEKVPSDVCDKNSAQLVQMGA